MSTENKIELQITEGILSMDIDCNDPCGCYIHEVICNTFELSSNQVSVLFDKITIDNTSCYVSPKLQEWQEEAVKLNSSGKKPKPITLILDKNTKIIYIKGEETSTLVIKDKYGENINAQAN